MRVQLNFRTPVEGRTFWSSFKIQAHCTSTGKNTEATESEPPCWYLGWWTLVMYAPRRPGDSGLRPKAQVESESTVPGAVPLLRLAY